MTPKSDINLTTIRPRLVDMAYLKGRKGCTISLVKRSGKGALEGDTYGVFLVLTRRSRRPGEDPKGTNRVAELVDAPDSKSGSPKGECRFESDLRYLQIPCKSRKASMTKAKPPAIEPGALGAVGYESASSIALAALSCMSGSTWL